MTDRATLRVLRPCTAMWYAMWYQIPSLPGRHTCPRPYPHRSHLRHYHRIVQLRRASCTPIQPHLQGNLLRPPRIVDAAFRAVLGAIPVAFNSLRNGHDLTNLFRQCVLGTRPVNLRCVPTSSSEALMRYVSMVGPVPFHQSSGRIVGELLNVLLDTIFVFFPSVICSGVSEFQFSG